MYRLIGRFLILMRNLIIYVVLYAPNCVAKIIRHEFMIAASFKSVIVYSFRHMHISHNLVELDSDIELYTLYRIAHNYICVYFMY